MNRNPVSAAIELVDTVPSNEFRSTVRAQLMAGFAQSATAGILASQRANAMLPDPDEEYIELTPNGSRVGPNRRFAKTVLAAAACVAVFATVIVSRAGIPPRASAELHDVNQQEALQLAQRATIAVDPSGQRWQDGSDWGRSALPGLAAASIAALPNCAPLTSVGLFPPTTKSAAAYQWVDHGYDLLTQRVFVFATPEDASSAMDVIAGENYRTCWFDLFDRDAFHSHGWTSTSEAWDAPKIARHGDRQIIFGQHSTLLVRFNHQEIHLVNAYVQVGRAITSINPRYIDDAGNPLVAVDKAITAATDALTRAVGP